MIRTLPLLLSVLAFDLCAQWSTVYPSVGARKDDIFFINPDTGWVAGGADGTILRTHDGGDTWQTVLQVPFYFRSIEFATPMLGFAGSLNNQFMRTTDGGDTWQNITDSIPPPSSICGLSAPTATDIYGVGVWSAPAYLIRSTDGGANWTKTSMATLATRLVDVQFYGPDTGYAAGTAQPASQGGVILGTTDGGDTWSVLHRTGHVSDIIWKIQSPDNGRHIYCSIDALSGTGGTRFVRSTDSGATWSTITATTDYHYIQAIGFLDTLRGWMGAETTLLETVDGGTTWTDSPFVEGHGYDRFHKVSATQAFMSGDGIYRFTDNSVGLPPITDAPRRPVEWIQVDPNPVAAEASIRMQVFRPSFTELLLVSPDGRTLRQLFRGELQGGEHRHTADLRDLPAGSYHMIMRTNQGQTSARFVKR